MEFERHHISKLIVALNWRGKDEQFVAEMLVSRDLYETAFMLRKKIRLIDNPSRLMVLTVFDIHMIFLFWRHFCLFFFFILGELQETFQVFWSQCSCRWNQQGCLLTAHKSKAQPIAFLYGHIRWHSLQQQKYWFVSCLSVLRGWTSDDSYKDNPSLSEEAQREQCIKG